MADKSNSKPCDCGCSCNSGNVPRRDFLKIAGLGVMATTLGVPVKALAAGQPSPVVSHFVQAEKLLPRGWLKSLTERGVKEVFKGEDLKFIGMPVNGIATGQLYLCGDGTLGCWEIFNHHEFIGTGEKNYGGRIPAKPVDFRLAVGYSTPGGASVEAASLPLLSEKRQGCRFYGTSSRRLNSEDFANVAFDGQYPIGTVHYSDPEFPLAVELEAFSPFIPLNARDSALPATIFSVTVKNTAKEPLEVFAASLLENAVCAKSAEDFQGNRIARLVQEEDRSMIVHSADETPVSEAQPERPPIILQDFEGDTYGDWKTTGEAFGPGPAHGTLPGQQVVTGFQGRGLADSFFKDDDAQGTLTSPPFKIERRHINFMIGGGNRPGETCVNLLIDGKVVKTATGENSEELKWQAWNVADLEGKQGQIEIVDRGKGGWGHINLDQIEMADMRRNGPIGPVSAQPDFGTMVLAMKGELGDEQDTLILLSPAERKKEELTLLQAYVEWAPESRMPFAKGRDVSQICSNHLRVAPGETHTFTFVLAWHFPNLQLRGHEYASRFADAAAVANYVLDNLDRLAGETRLWRDTYYDGTLPYWLLDRLHSTVCNLATGTTQWWKNGRFWAWEGVVCCEGTCTHVWNYSHAEARLFPELTRIVRERQDFTPVKEGGGFHPETGLVGNRSNDEYAADGQCGSVLKAYREHQMSADAAFLKRNWPKIKLAIEFLLKKDHNDDGLIEDIQPNTYDIAFAGPNTFVGSLYLAALRAGEEMANEVGDHKFARRLHHVFEKGKKLSVEKLWDGEYFVQSVDPKKFPKDQYGAGCLADQLFGQGWAHQVGIGYIYPPDKVRKALQSIWKYNWATDIGPQNAAHKPLRWFVNPGEAGLFTCTWPKSPYLDSGVIYKEEVWTGIEYQVAGNMIWDGMVEEGLAICRAVHDRYHPLKRNPYNEVECSDHYARAMASWGVYTALAGFEYHGPKQHIGFAPRITPEDFRAAFTSAEGWGTFSQKREGKTQTSAIRMAWGRLPLKSIRLAVPKAKIAKVTATVAGKSVKAKHERESSLMIEFPEGVTVGKGETLDIEVSFV